METVEIVAIIALILSILLLLKVFSLQRQLNEIQSDLYRLDSKPEVSELSKQKAQESAYALDQASVSSSAKLDEKLRMLLAAGNRIQAIKEYKEASKLSLKEAKEYVDDLERR